MCAGNAVFSKTQVVSESKIAREILCFSKKRGAKVGCVRRRLRLCPPMVAYARLSSDRCYPLGSEIIGRESQCNGGVKVVLGGRFAAQC